MAAPTGLSTGQLAAAAGCSAQQVRDLERLGVIAPGHRGANGYRRFDQQHLDGVRAYRLLVTAVGPVEARRAIREVRREPTREAAALINVLHVGLAQERAQALAARSALSSIHRESTGSQPEDAAPMTISQLAGALGVRTSTLRFWESEGLVRPDRVTSFAVRSYPEVAIREARITAALRSAGYRIPEVRLTIAAVRQFDRDQLDDPIRVLDDRLDAIGRRTVALLEAGAELVRLLRNDAHRHGENPFGNI